MATWDRRTAADNNKQRAAAIRSQVIETVGPFSPFWRQRLQDLGRTPEQVATAGDLRTLPAVGERDVCPDGRPEGAAALVLQAGEAGYALHVQGPALRRALVRRVVSPGAYARVVEQDTRPTTFVWAGLSLDFPVASTRGDLDVIARCGARAWAVLGLGRDDVLVTALPGRPTAVLQALELGALGAGAPALAAGVKVEDVIDALSLLPATVLAVSAGRAAELVRALAERAAPLRALRTLLLVGAPDAPARSSVQEALAQAGLGQVVVLVLHVADGHRLPWAQCRESASGLASDQVADLHTHPDLELLQLVEPESGDPAARGAGGEVVLTQLGLRGTALLRWRTGDLVDGLADQACPSCGRTARRVVRLRSAAMVPHLQLASGPSAVDLRGVCGALAGRPDVHDWRVQLRPDRHGVEQLVVHVQPAPGTDPTAMVLGVHQDVRDASGHAPSQIVLARRRDLEALDDAALSRLSARVIATAG